MPIPLMKICFKASYLVAHQDNANLRRNYMSDKYNIDIRRDAENNIDNFVKGGKNEDPEVCRLS